MIVAEDFEDIEHRGARLVLERTLVANNRKKTVERGFELRARGERLGELDPQLLVVWIGSKAFLEIGEVMTTRCLEPSGRLESVDLRVRNQTAEHDQRFFGFPAVDEE